VTNRILKSCTKADGARALAWPTAEQHVIHGVVSIMMITQTACVWHPRCETHLKCQAGTNVATKCDCCGSLR